MCFAGGSGDSASEGSADDGGCEEDDDEGESEGEGEGEGEVRVSHSEGEEGDFRSNHFSAPWMAMPTSDTLLRAAPATWSSRWPATALPP